MQAKKGFTLIELLVVIAIIGILSGTVIVSMSGAQDSAKNARIKSGMDQLRSYAEVYRLLNSGYIDGSSNFTNTGDGLLITEDMTNAANGSRNFTVGAPTATAYCMSISLNGTSTNYLCMDSTGKVVEGATKICAATTCP